MACTPIGLSTALSSLSRPALLGCKATPARAKGTGEAVRHLCLNARWARSSLYRHVRQAAAEVAAGLNPDRALALGPRSGPSSFPSGSTD